jgi:drug/metabolite transporter (DMT)-like permease
MAVPRWSERRILAQRPGVDVRVMTAVLALAASAFWGASDFMGGAVSRRLAAFDVIFVSQALAVLILGFAAFVNGSFGGSTAYLPWAVAAGIIGVLSVGAFYKALAEGTMGVVAPIAASGVIVPLVVGVAEGNRVSGLQVAGIALAVIGVILASGPDLRERSQASARPIVLAVLAAVGFGAGVVCIAQASRTSVVMTLLTLRITSVGCLVIAAVALRRVPRVTRGDLPPLAVIGLFDLAANAAYASSTTGGALSLVAVLASLYPAVTVVLARQLHREHLGPLQAGGATAAVLGAVLIAAGGTG